MRFTKSKIMFVVMILLCLFVVGCITKQDPVTGVSLHSLDPNTVTDLQELGGVASVVLGILGGFWPLLLPIAGYIGGAVRISRKLTPKLTEAQTKSQMYHTIASSTILGVEEFKKSYPKEWDDLEIKLGEIKDKIVSADDRLKIENVIRGLRGLLPKI